MDFGGKSEPEGGSQLRNAVCTWHLAPSETSLSLEYEVQEHTLLGGVEGQCEDLYDLE